MKRILKMAIIFITFIFFCYDVGALSYEESVSKAEMYLIKEYDLKNTYSRYLITVPNTRNIGYYENYDKTNNSFAYGGLLSEREFNITTRNKGNRYSYLYESDDYWTLTTGEDSEHKKVISLTTNELKIDVPENNKPGLRVTEYVRNDATVVGTGEYSDPWILIPQYEVKLKVNIAEDGEEKGKLKDPKTGNFGSSVKMYLTSNSIEHIEINAITGYQYLGNTCGYIINDADVRNGSSNKLIVHEISRDFECTINFGEKPLEIKLDNDTIDDNDGSLQKVYLLPGKSWYNDEQAQNQTSKVNNVPTKQGHTTIGFYLSKEQPIERPENCKGTQYIDGTGNIKVKAPDISRETIGEDTKLYPCYRPNQYKVNYDCNGGSGTVASTTHIYSQGTTLSSNENGCTLEGYKFVGWNTNREGTGAQYPANEPISDNIIEDPSEGEEITLYVEWEKLTKYTATFELNGASSLSKTEVYCYTDKPDEGCKITTPSITPAGGFTALGFNTVANSTSKTVNQSTEITIKNDTKYYAITKSVSPITITFKPNGATDVTSSLECYRYNGKNSCKITSPIPTVKTGYTLIGFNTNQNATDKQWAANTAKDVSADATYYVIQSKEIKGTFNTNGAASIGASTVKCTLYNAATSCQITTPTITAASGFSVVGWNTNQNATSSSINVSTNINISENTTYYAITRKQITASFNANGASSIGSTSQSCYAYNGSADGCSITSPSITAASGFSVVGWNINQNATTSELSVNSSTVIKTNKTYYAITRKQITVTFNANGASSIGATTKSCYAYNGSTAGCSITSPGITPASGFTALGWNTSSGATSSSWTVNQEKTFTSNATYNAITRKQITITFDKNGASSIGSTSQSCYAYNGSTAGCSVTSPSITAASGFSLLGWNTNASATSSAWNQSTALTVTSNTTYYAITRKQITITFNKNGASAIGSTSQSCYAYNGSTAGCSITSPSITAASGFSVLGWNTNASATSSAWTQSTSKTVTSNATYNAITRKQITITFDRNGANAIGSTSQSCYAYNGSTAGCSVTSPSITASTGFTVVGWNTNASATSSAWNQSTALTVTSNTTYYAITRSSSLVTVTFVQNGAGSIGSTSLTCYKYNGADSCNITSPTITAASGFTVVGWNTSSGATSSSWTQSTSKSFEINATYYAITKSSSQITVTFNKNGAGSIGSTSQSCYRYNGASTCSVTSPSITAASGFTVIGWNTSSGSTSSSWTQGTSKSFSSAATYYAITKSSSQITVTFNKNGASAISSTSQSCYRYNGSSSCSVTSPSITAASGFTVVGWNTSASATTNGWTPSTSKSFSSNTTYNAITQSSAAISVTFVQNGAGSIGSTSQSCYRYNGSSTCNITSPSITAASGFTVVGWNTSSGSTTNGWTPSTAKSFSSAATYYAITKSSNQITISFSANGASSIGATSKSCYRYNGASTCSVTSPTITAASGFTVVGWNTSSGATANGWTQNTSKAFSSAKTYYAITKSSNQITVTFNKNGASSIGATSQSCYRYNGSSSCNITSPAITAASGFSVLGWNTSSSATSSGWSQNTSKSFSSNATYNAITRKTVTITFNANGGSVSPTSATCYTYNGSTGTCAVTLPTPSRSGYQFNGWYTATSGGTKVGNGGVSYSASSSGTINAQWGQLHTLPIFTYTGSYQLVKDDDTVIASGTGTKVSIPSSYATYTGHWKIRFLSSGTITFHELRSASSGIDVFAVGGGGNGGSSYSTQAGRSGYASGGGGGGGGYRTTKRGVSVSATSYSITIGAARGTSSGFGASASGGGNGSGGYANLAACEGGPAGGSGGAAGGQGTVNLCSAYNGGTGGKEFGESQYSKYYGGGGGGGHGHNGAVSWETGYKPNGVGPVGNGGTGGGGTGNNQYRGANTHNGAANTGGGGGGASFVFDRYDAGNGCWSSNGCFNVSRTTQYPAGTGGTGIVIIRNKR